MTGIDKILAKIKDDSEASCLEIVAQATTQTQKILEDARSKGVELRRNAIASVESTCITNIALAMSKTSHERQKALLEAKNEVINKVIVEAMNRLRNLSEKEYFHAIGTLVMAHAREGLGILHFSRTDLDRMPSNFESDISNMINDSNKSVKISNDPAFIEDGFVIVYDDIELNCTFESLLNASLDDIKDNVNEEIFARGGL